MTNGWIFIGSVATVVVSVTLPRAQNASTSRVALELVFGARNFAIELIRAVPTVINAITQGRGRGAVVIAALELSRFAETLFARTRFIRSIRTVLFAVALPIQGDATIVLATTTMLAC